MGNIANGTINTFVDGDVVSANGTAPALLRSALNPKMEVIRTAINDNDSRIAILEGQIGTVGGLIYNVKSAPFNAVGNGIADDTVAIQTAINTAVANQGIVVIPNGIYKLTDALTVSGTCYITSDGAGQGAILAPSVANKAVFIINSSYVRITDLKLLINVNNSTSAAIYSVTATALSRYQGILIRGCTIYTTNSSSFHGIRFDYVSYSEISSCVISNTDIGVVQGNGIEIRSGLYLIISQNIISSAFACVMVTRSSGSLTTYPQSKYVFVDQNSFISVIQYGVMAYSTIDCKITGNNFYTYGTVAKYVFVSSVASDLNVRLEILGNVFDGSFIGSIGTVLAIQLNYSEFTTIANNTFIECGSNTASYGALRISIFSTNSTIESNLFNACQYAGISFDLNTTIVSSNTSILSNKFVDIYNPVALGICAAIYYASLELLTISNNQLVRGSKIASTVNSVGLYIATLSTDGAFVSYSGNNFRAAGITVFSVSSVICVFYEEPTGDRVFKGFGSAPTTGVWSRGDKVLVDSPSASGYIGYVCTTAGTPGTWKGYGAIEA